MLSTEFTKDVEWQLILIGSPENVVCGKTIKFRLL